MQPNNKKQFSSPLVSGYVLRFVAICVLIFAGGILLAALILYLSTSKDLGVSYQQSFAIVMQLKNELLNRSIMITAGSLLLITFAAAFIIIRYTHRVVGPMYRLHVVARAMAGGDFSTPVTLRSKDVIKPLADDLNAMISHYGEAVDAMKTAVRAMRQTLDAGARSESEEDCQEVFDSIRTQEEEVKTALEAFKL